MEFNRIQLLGTRSIAKFEKVSSTNLYRDLSSSSLGHLGDSWAAHVVPVPPSPYANVASAMIPDGGLHCNLDSWQRYLAAHLSEDEDFLPKDMWTYIHTPITQGFYGFGWMIDNSNYETGKLMLGAC